MLTRQSEKAVTGLGEWQEGNEQGALIRSGLVELGDFTVFF